MTLLDLLYPPKCILCDCLLPKRQDLCENCRETAPIFKKQKRKLRFLDSYTAVWYYKEYARESLLRYKFVGYSFLSKPYGRFLAARIRQDYPQGVDLITWVPISARRKRKRGYDQCQRLAKAVGSELGMKPRQTLRKVRDNPAQSSLSDPSLRRGNVMGVYAVRKPEQVRGKRILLIDDILTTGSTAGECARMLKTAGAAEVHCAVVAATEK